MSATADADPRIYASTILRENPVIAVLRATHAREYAPIIAALMEGGVLSIELTLSTEGVFEELAVLKAEFGTGAEIGVGTVTTREQAHLALDAGADYLVTPVTDEAIVAVAVEQGKPVFPGGLTPTELHRGWAAGATAVKVFPASVVGPGYVSALRGPFPGIEVIPSGGVDLESAAAWTKAGALAVSVGGPMLGDAFAGGDLSELTARARKFTQTVRSAREAR